MVGWPIGHTLTRKNIWKKNITKRLTININFLLINKTNVSSYKLNNVNFTLAFCNIAFRFQITI